MSEKDVLVSRLGRIGHIRLNRPKALNSLTLDMVRSFARALDEFGEDDAIISVLLTGAGERGLCAGGDIRGFVERVGGAENPYKQFWREEYRLNARIASFPKPFVALMDGVVMGGGVGVSAHGNRRLVTDRTRLAMPEASIGFIPDVGGTWLLTRNGGAGIYMGLSGVTVGAADAIYAGLADLCIESADAPRLIARLEKCRRVQEIDAALLGSSCGPGESVLHDHKGLLDEAMSLDTVEAIVAALVAIGSVFAREAAQQILRNSPTSLRLTHELLKRAKRADSLETCLLFEFRAACALLDSHDLREGVRAAIVDKDKNPKWAPAKLADVDAAAVESLLADHGDAPPNFETWRRKGAI